MGTRIIEGVDGEGDEAAAAVFYCSTSGRAFGPVFRGTEADVDALNGLQRFARERGFSDLRALSEAELDDVVEAWRAAGAPSETAFEDTDA